MSRKRGYEVCQIGPRRKIDARNDSLTLKEFLILPNYGTFARKIWKKMEIFY
jgi:hypothetical protein